MRVWWRGAGWLTVVFLTALGLFVVMLFPYSVYQSKFVVPWSFVPAHVGCALWFVNSMVWLTLACFATVPAVPAFFRRAGGNSASTLFLIYSILVAVVAASMVLVPVYVISLGIIDLAPNGGVAYSVYDFDHWFVTAALIPLPLYLAGVLGLAEWLRASHRRSAGSDLVDS